MIGKRGKDGLAWANPRVSQAAASAIFLALALFLLKDNVGTLQSIAPAEVIRSYLHIASCQSYCM